MAGGSFAAWNGPGAAAPLNAHTSGGLNGGDIVVVKLSQARSIRYATPAGSGDCSTWANACTLQAALTGAVSGDEIWAAAGTHKPTAGTELTATFQLKDGVALYGGFAATETPRAQRDYAANITILSGDLSGNDNDNVSPYEATRADNSYHVVTGATGAALDGFTITGGNAGAHTSPNDSGGGLYNNSSNPVIANGIAAPVVEELYFRGYLLPRIPASRAWAPLVNVLLFSLYHFFSPWQNVTRIVALIPLVYGSPGNATSTWASSYTAL